MGSNFGTGVSRVLSPDQANLVQVVWQQGKPPTDADLNLMQQLDDDWRRILVLRGTPSGWLGNATNAAQSFVTNPAWSNWFKFGQQRAGEARAIEWACVNGWLIPVTGTLTGTPPGSPDDASTWNRITLDPPPANSGDARIDFVFLEAWLARTPPNPSTSNKPSASGIWRYGNVEGGFSFLPDDMVDPAMGFETSQRIQLQYRIRVVTGLVGLSSYPDGFDPTVVKARGAASANTSYVFTNMRQTLGDPGLWRAGDGTSNALGTVDGYSYAVPIAAVFRRNSIAWDGDPSQNLNGGFNRNPTAVDRTNYKTFSTTPTLSANMTSGALTLSLASVSNIALPLTPATPVLIQVDDEIMTYSVITGTTMTITQRGALGTKAEAHKSGAVVKVLAGRPDGLFADQVAKTDILDLRHAVNPNGFDATTLLKSNFDKLLRGELRSNWKRSGGGPQGAFVTYQDKISASAAALGVTKLDAPDNIRTVFSDAAVQQPVEVILTPPTASGPAQAVSTAWGLSLTATANASLANNFQAGDVITIPVAQLKTGLPGSDADQVRFLGSSDGAGSVELRIDGDYFHLQEGVDFSVTASPTSSTDLAITLLASPAWPTTRRLYATVHVLYGPGRGMSRRPDSIHSIAYLSGGSDIMTQQAGVPSDNIPLRTAWAPLWSKFQDDTFGTMLPVTAEAYADPGSRTVILTPFRRIDQPDVLRTLDGSSVNANTGVVVESGGTGSSNGSTTFTDTNATFAANGVVVGDIVRVTSPASVAGDYHVASGIAATTVVLDRVMTTATNIVYQVFHTQGLMPLLDRSGAAKWATTDPLNLFRGTTHGDAARKNIFVPLPRHLVPGWGEVRVPIIHTDTSTFDEGINFLVLTTKGNRTTKPNSERNYTPFSNGSLSYAPFSTLNLNTVSTAATYNAQFTYAGNAFAGMRFFTDARGLGRQGLELPPFYGISRLFAVYEAEDYKTNGSAYDPTTREFVGGATNLLRQNFDGATFWIEIDADGDSTFILNAQCIDISKSPNPIASFSAGHYVIEANIFGFDRGSFDINEGFRLVLTREVISLDATQAGSASRPDNLGTGVDADLASPDLVVPGPALASDEIAINYSRTPYQGDAWGSQTAHQDIGHFPGPLTSGTAFQIASTVLDELNLTRPNQKALEVLDSIGFATTLGTGRIAGFSSFGDNPIDFDNYGYENGDQYPPASGIAARPELEIGALTSAEGAVAIGTEYSGCTERLPMGALFRDKDFRGGSVSGSGDADFDAALNVPLKYITERAPGISFGAVAPSLATEQTEIPVHTVSLASGQPGEIVVHVDGEQGNYSLLTNFRTHRGGSAFSAMAPRPGGDIVSVMHKAGSHPSTPRVLTGLAMLVRNAVTNVGGNEVSAGGEVMMLVVTSVHQLSAGASSGSLLSTSISTSGTGEGYAAADLYRLEGRPIVKDNVRLNIDPSTISLSKGLR